MSYGKQSLSSSSAISRKEEINNFITMTVSGQLFGISVHMVRDVLAPQKITPIPLAPKEVAGSLNLRGRIVTAIDIRKRLALEEVTPQIQCMSVVVEHQDELYSLLVDTVGEVLQLPLSALSHNPENLTQSWQEVSLGVHTLKDSLLIILDVQKLLQFISSNSV